MVYSNENLQISFSFVLFYKNVIKCVTNKSIHFVTCLKLCENKLFSFVKLINLSKNANFQHESYFCIFVSRHLTIN